MKIIAGKHRYLKLILFVFLFALIFTAIAAIIAFNIEVNRASQKARIMIGQLIATIESTANVAVYANNTQIAQEVLEGLLRNDVIYKVMIRNDQNLQLERSKGYQVEPAEEIVHDLISPFNNQRIIGQLRITPDNEFSLKEAKYTALINAINAFVLVSITSLIMLIIVRFFFFKPLVQLSNALHDMLGNEQQQIKPLKHSENDELGILVSGINKTLENLTEQQILRQRIEEEEKKLRHIFESTSAGLFLLDEKGDILVCTPTLQKIMDCENVGLDAIAGHNFAQLFFNEPEQFNQMLDKVIQFNQLETADLMLKSSELNPLWVHCLISKIVGSDGETRFEGVLFDISKRVEEEKVMLYAANHDSLTGLLRRNAAEEKFKKRITAENNVEAAVLLLDLDGFKKANDTYGHDVGDIVLIHAAHRLEACVRQGDIVCRLGGDEFLIVLFDIGAIENCFHIAEKIINLIKIPVTINEHIDVHVGVSIGIAVFALHGYGVETLIKAADEAMYEVKRQGKNGYAIKNKDGVMTVTKPV